MEIDKKLIKDYEGKMRCDLCGRVLKVGEKVETIQTGMFIEGDVDETMVQYGVEQVVIVICEKTCSQKVKVIVEEKDKCPSCGEKSVDMNESEPTCDLCGWVV